MASLGNASLDITIDKKSIANQLLEGIDVAQKEAKGKTITYQIAADKASIAKLEERIEKLKPEVRAGIIVDFSTDQFEKKLSGLNSFVGKKATEIGKEFSKAINSAIPKNISEKKLAESVFGSGTKSGYSGVIKELNKDVKLDFDVNKVTSLSELQSYTEGLQKLQIALNNIGDKKVTGVNTDKLKGIVSTQLDSIYKNAGKVIEAKTPQWINELQELANSDFSSLMKLVDSLKNGLSIGSGSGSSGSGITQEIKDLTEQLEKAKKLSKELDNAKMISKKQLETAYNNSGDGSSGDKQFVKTFQDYIKYGGEVKSINKDIVEYYNDMKGAVKDFVPIKQLELYRESLMSSEEEVEKLQAKIESLSTQQSSAVGQNVTPQSSDEIKDQSSEVKKLQENLNQAKSTIQEVTDKYITQSNIVEELENKLKILKDIKDPKVLESNEYKQMVSDLEEATNSARSYSSEVDSLERHIDSLQQSLSSYKSGDVVDKTSYERAETVIDNLYKKIDKLKISLQQVEEESKKFEDGMYVAESQRDSLTTENSNQQNVISSQEKQISNLEQVNAELEESKRKHEEILKILAEIEVKRKSVRDGIDYKDAYNNATKNVYYNRNQDKAPSNFVQFDYLDQIKKKMQETGNEQEKLIKMAVYYNAYLKDGGKEKIIGADGTDISDQLISKYKELHALVSKNGLIENENAIKVLNGLNAQSLELEEKISDLEKTNALLREQIKLEQEAAKASQAMNNNAKVKAESKETKSATSKSKSKMSASEFKEQMSKDHSSTESSSKTGVVQVDNSKAILAEKQALGQLNKKVVEVTTSFNNKTQAITQEKIAMDVAAQGEVNSLQDIINKVEELRKKIAEISNIKLDVKVNDNQNGDVLDEKSTKALASLKESLKGFNLNELSALGEVIKGLKVSKANVDNLQRLSNVILTLKSNLNNLSDKGVDFLSTIERITSKSNELKDLSNVLKSTAKQIQSVSETTKAVSKTAKSSTSSSTSSTKSDIGKNYVKDLENAKKEAYEFNDALNLIKNNFNTIAKSKDFNMDDSLSIANLELDKLNKQFYKGSMSIQEYNTKANQIAMNMNSVISKAGDINQATNAIKNYVSTMSQGNVEFKRMETNSKGISVITARFEDQKGQLRNLKFEYNEVANSIKLMRDGSQDAVGGLSKFFTSLKGKFGDLTRYLLTFASFYQIVAWIREGITVVKDLDSALTEMRKVSDETVESLKNFQKESFNIANEVGATAKTIQNSTADWMRLGESMQEAAESAKVSNILLNVSEFESIDEATESLVAMSAAYKDLEKIDIVDKLNNVGKTNCLNIW